MLTLVHQVQEIGALYLEAVVAHEIDSLEPRLLYMTVGGPLLLR